MLSGELNTQNRFRLELHPGSHWVRLHHSPRPPSWWARGLAAPPVPKNLTPASALRASSFGPLGLAPLYLLTFDYLPRPLPVIPTGFPVEKVKEQNHRNNTASAGKQPSNTHSYTHTYFNTPAVHAHQQLVPFPNVSSKTLAISTACCLT